MAVQENTNLTTDFAKAQSIDFVNRFTGGIKKLVRRMLGITRRQGRLGRLHDQDLQEQRHIGRRQCGRGRSDPAVQGGKDAGQDL